MSRQAVQRSTLTKRLAEAIPEEHRAAVLQELGDLVAYHLALSPKQRAVLDFIRRYLAKHRYSPTLDEIGAHLGVTKITVWEHINQLQRKGMVVKKPNFGRSVVPVEEVLSP